jgi:chromosome partitioning protein
LEGGRDPKMRCIAIANQKGGCGKTTTAVCLALCLKDMGNKVLVTDMDPQGSATQSLFPGKESLEHTIYDLLVDSDKVPIEQAMNHVDANLDLLPANVILSSAEQMLAGKERREERLRSVLDRIQGDYDFAIIDSPPNIGLLTFNSLTAADEVIIPVDPSFFSLQGVSRVIEALELLESINGHKTTFRVLATMYDSRTRISRELVSALRTSYRECSFDTIIRSNITLKESTGFGVPITNYRGSRGFYDYRSLAHEISGSGATQKSMEIEAIEDFLAPRRIGGGVLFSFMDGEAEQVDVEGDFNSWDHSHDALLDVDGRGLWQRVVTLRPGRHHYRFVADGRAVTDPNNTRTEFLEGQGLVSVIEI